MGKSQEFRNKELYKLISDRHPQGPRLPISKQQLCDRMGFKDKNGNGLKLALKRLRDLGCVIPYSREHNGYFLESTTPHAESELDVRFTRPQLVGLLAMHELLQQLEPDLTEVFTGPVKEMITKEFGELGLRTAEIKRIRIMGVAKHDTPRDIFETVAMATVSRQRLHLVYHSLSKDQETRRDVSPQHLVSYNGTWYMDTYCHRAENYRMFSLSAIVDCHMLEETAWDMDAKELNKHVTKTYGIFPGAVIDKAILRFTPHRSRWVEKEIWHPEQHEKRLEDGSYQLEVPYGRSEELMMDILKYGPDVEVIGPPELRDEVALRLKTAAECYPG